MKVLSVSTSDMRGGAAKAAYRLHQGLLSLGVDSKMLVQSKSGEDPTVIAPLGKFRKGLSALRPTLDMLPISLFGGAQRSFSTAWLPDGLDAQLQRLSPDIIHLHWVNKGFVRIESLPKFRGRLVWTLHDMWPMTGGCHSDLGCERYQEACGNCPQLGRACKHDLSDWILRRKKRAWDGLDLTLVCPSRWMAECAWESTIFREKRIEVIPNGLDLEVFRPVGRAAAREWLGLPKEKRLLLFSAINPLKNPYKGFAYFQQAMHRLRESQLGDDLEIVILGSNTPQEKPNLPFPAHYMGVLHDEISLALIYAAVDLLAAPSIQDNLPQTVMEAIACGTPCAGFRVGGIPDMITDQENGYLADFGDVQDIAHGIEWILEKPERYAKLSNEARLKAERQYDQKKTAKQYIDLYQDLIRRQGQEADG